MKAVRRKIMQQRYGDHWGRMPSSLRWMVWSLMGIWTG